MADNLSPYERRPIEHPVSILSIPFELGSDARGLAKSPQYLFESGLGDMLEAISANVSSYSTIECPAASSTAQFPKYLQETVEVAEKTSGTVAAMRRKKEIVLALCGDHASAMGTIKGAAGVERVGVIYIDAHPDIHTPETTITRNTHGMVASAALGTGHPSLTSIGGTVRPENFLFLGVQDFDTAEITSLRRSSTTAITMLDIALHGLSGAVSAIDSLRRRVDSIWVSMDMDSIDSAYAPGVAMPCESGFTKREILSLSHYIGRECRIAGVDIVEMLPEKDIGKKTAALAIELVARFLGSEYTSYRSYMREYEATRGQVQGAKRPHRRAKAAARRA